MNMWDERYRSKEYVYGVEANHFFKEKLSELKPGHLLLPAEGEGRNAVFAAISNWQVTAFDASIEGKIKAEALAKLHKVDINYLLCPYQEMDFEPNSFDAIALIYAHMPYELRKKVHTKLIDYLKPGGHLIIEGFSEEQLNYQSGGPKEIEMLYSISALENEFKTLSTRQITQHEIELSEGLFHNGKASVIRLWGKK